MKILRRKRPSREDSSALSDLAFLLIIYFIVIAGFNVNKGFLMSLPTKDSTRFVLRDELLRFELDASGTLVFRGAPTDFSLAEKEIQKGLDQHPNIAVVLTVDPEAPWQKVVSFVELAQRLQVDSFSFTPAKAAGSGL
ncbi:MAG: biopolymer transporter ExbD [Spirochaetales bacterium]|jgi:biopolymer transport protein ExbD|nr:biopolymer transporter ExbD [Spirochaetales bacterium]